MKKQIILWGVVIAIGIGVACTKTAWKRIGRVSNKAVSAFCHVFGAEDQGNIELMCSPREELNGISLAQFCAIYEPLSPVIDIILRAPASCEGYGTPMLEIEEARHESR